MNIMREMFSLVNLVNVFKIKQDLIYRPYKSRLVRSHNISLRGLSKHFSR